MKTNIQNSKGFTLLELTIVLGVIATLSFLSAPSVLTWLPNFHLRSAAGEMLSNMQWVKLNAIKNNREWGIQFDSAANRYLVMDSTDGVWSNGDDRIVKTVSLDSYGGEVQFGFGDAASDMDGNSPPAGTITFTGNMTVYNGRGMANESGFIYLKNNKETAYGLGNNVSAYIFMRKWMGDSWG